MIKNHIKTLAFTTLDILQNIYGVNSLYFTISHASGYIEQGVNKYVIFDQTDGNKELLKKHNELIELETKSKK